MTETVTTNEQFTEQNTEQTTAPATSLLKTALWLAVMLFVPQILLSIGFGIFLGIQQGSEYTPEAFELWFASMPVLLTLTLMAPLLTLPLLNKATQAKGWAGCFEFWALKRANAKEITKWLLIGLAFWLVSSFIGEWLNLPVEQFMLDVKAASNNATIVTLVLVTICIVAPVMEELIFRGWLFSRIAQTKLGDIGALILSSLLFTAIHTQYDNIITLIMIFSLGLLLGFIRYKSNNISYCIAVHILFNSLAMTALFFFL